MAITMDRNTGAMGFSAAYEEVRAFLLDFDAAGVTAESFTWGRWEWIFCKHGLDPAKRPLIDVWRNDGRVVGLVTNEEAPPGYAWFCLDPGYPDLRAEMLTHAERHLRDDHAIRVLIDNRDLAFQKLAAQAGYKATNESEELAVLPVDAHDLSYVLPPGYHAESMADVYDVRKFNRLMWRGFNHEGEPPESEQALLDRSRQLSGPHEDLDLNIVIVAPDGSFASYCGMWHEPGSTHALVEPVATDPAHRRKGLGRAAVLEAVRRCAQRGAENAYVGSTQPFYYAIGFHPWLNATWWKKDLQ